MFKKRVSILAALFIGTFTAVFVFIGILMSDFLLSAWRGYFGTPQHMDAIAVGEGYSVEFIAQHIHPYLAEYDQFLGIYGGAQTGGDYLGRVKIETNTGGRVRIGLFVPKGFGEPELLVLQRYSLSRINLRKLTKSRVSDWRSDFSQDDLPQDRAYTFLGWVSGASYPLKFIPCSIWPKLSQAEREAVIHGNPELDDLC